MKKLIHNLRIWLLERLGGVDMAQAAEWKARAEAKANEYYRGQIACYRDRVWNIAAQNNKLYEVVREICRRSENSYYDWCCEYCTAAYEKFVGDRKKVLAKQRKDVAAYNVLARGFIIREKKARHLGFKAMRRNRGT